MFIRCKVNHLFENKPTPSLLPHKIRAVSKYFFYAVPGSPSKLQKAVVLRLLIFLEVLLNS